MTGDPQSARMCRCHIIKTRSLAPSLVKEPGCVYDDLTSTCQTLDGIQTGLRPQASCKHTTTVLLSLSPGPRNKPPTRAWTMVMLMAHAFSSSSHNTIMCCGNGCASGPDNNKATPRPPPPPSSLCLIHAWTSLWGATEIITGNLEEFTGQGCGPCHPSSAQREFKEGMNEPKVEQMHRFRQDAFPQMFRGTIRKKKKMQVWSRIFLLMQIICLPKNHTWSKSCKAVSQNHL